MRQGGCATCSEGAAPGNMIMPDSTPPQRLTEDQTVRYVGARPLVRMTAAVLWSMFFCVLFFMTERTIVGDPFALLSGAVIGVIAGLFPVGLIMVIVVLRVRALPAMLVCFGSAAFSGVLGLGLLGDDYIGLFAGVGLCLAASILFLFGPRYKVYCYATCPGCKYDLSLLPKSDVCPECGRDNRDLVEAFADVYR